MTAFDRDDARDIRTSLDDALAEWAVANGLGDASIVGRITYGEQITLKVEILPANGEPQTVTDFRHYATQVGLQASDLGREFSLGGTLYKVSGYRRHAKKHNILITDVATGDERAGEARLLREALARMEVEQ